VSLLGAARAPSPDVRYGLRPSLTPRRPRFAILAALADEACSGLPVPRRRTFATGSALRSLRAGHASPSWLRSPTRPALGARAAPRDVRPGHEGVAGVQ